MGLTRAGLTIGLCCEDCREREPSPVQVAKLAQLASISPECVYLDRCDDDSIDDDEGL